MAEDEKKYTYKYKDKTDGLEKQIADRKFEYDVNDEELYKTYEQIYTKNGQRAMQDTMAKASAMTGGYGNSYAATAGQQVYNGYMEALDAKIPELEALALEKYNAETDELYKEHSFYSDLEQQNYENWLSEQVATNPEVAAVVNGTYLTENKLTYEHEAAIIARHQSHVDHMKTLPTMQQRNDYVKNLGLTETEQNVLLGAVALGGIRGSAWEKGYDGGWNGGWGIDNDATVKFASSTDENGTVYTTYRLDELYDHLVDKEGLSKDEAKAYVLALQSYFGY